MISERASLWLRLAMVRGIGPLLGRKLALAAGGIDVLWAAHEKVLGHIEGIGPKLQRAFKQSKAELADEIIAFCRLQQIGVLCPDDADWPDTLQACDDAPLILFYRGDAVSLASPRMLAMVGARRAGREGCMITRRWSRHFATAGVSIVSGMAYGIDSAAHGGALEAGGLTVAVLGCGLASLNEQQQTQVNAIAERGCVVSEFLPELSARPEYFPRRNRIIAALSHATLVLEADVRSGSLITARQALEYGREVFAMPGSVLGGNHAGCHQLIRDGAVLVESTDDVLKYLDWKSRKSASSAAGKHYMPADEKEASVLTVLASESMHLDHLVESCGLTLPELSPILLRLELQGVIERLPGSRYMVSVELSES